LSRREPSQSFIASKKAIASNDDGAEEFLLLSNVHMSRFIKLYQTLLRAPIYVIERCTAILFLSKHVSLWSGARSSGRPIIVNSGSMTIGRGFKILNFYAPVEINCSEGAEVAIGSNVHINYGVLINARRRVRIGNNVMIGNLSIISDTVFPLQPGQDAPFDDQPKPVEVADD
jgi:acetyltransferase-like isoleucine patch superfamily enzyme